MKGGASACSSGDGKGDWCASCLQCLPSQHLLKHSHNIFLYCINEQLRSDLGLERTALKLSVDGFGVPLNQSTEVLRDDDVLS